MILAALASSLLLGFLLDRHQQQQNAARERDRAVQVSNFLGNLFAVSDLRDAKGAELTMQEVLDHGAERLEQELEGQADLKAELLMRISDGYHNLGLFDSALPLQEKARELIRDRRDPLHPDMAEVLMGLASTYGNISRYAEAEACLREARDIYIAIGGTDSQGAIDATNALAIALMDVGRYKEAEPLFRRSLATTQHTKGIESRSASAITGNLGMLLYLQGKYEESGTYLRQALAISSPLLGREDPMTSSQLFHLGNLLRLQGKYSQAGPILLDVLSVYRRKLGEHPAVSRTLHTLAKLRLQEGRLSEAMVFGQEALRLRRRFRGELHPAFADTLLCRAEILLQIGEHEEAEIRVRQALAIYADSLPKENWRPAHGRSVLAACQMARGEYGEVEGLLSQAEKTLSAARGSQAPETLRTQARLARLMQRP
jgi:tetratricopeptide (TPR) repeat protein